MIKKLFCVALLIFVAATFVFSQGSKRKKIPNGERLIAALTKSKKINAVFGDDGVLLFKYEPEVRRIVRLGKRAIPLLIAHLDDKRAMPHLSFNVSRYAETVTVGDFCFDFLLRLIVRTRALFDKECEDESAMLDSPDQCLKAIYTTHRKNRKWSEAYRKGKVVYDSDNIMIDTSN